MEDISRHFDIGQISILILIDFSKAFDTVNNSTLLLLTLKKYVNFNSFQHFSPWVFNEFEYYNELSIFSKDDFVPIFMSVLYGEMTTHSDIFIYLRS